MILKKSALSLEYERTQSSRSAKSREVICPETSQRVTAPEHPKAQGNRVQLDLNLTTKAFRTRRTIIKHKICHLAQVSSKSGKSLLLG